MTLNSLPDSLRDPTLSDDKFRAALKTHFSPVIRTCSTLKTSCMITYLLDETGSYTFTDASISTLLATENDI